MSSKWTQVRLQDITSIVGDGLHGTPEYDANGEYFFINGNNLGDGKITLTAATKRVSLEQFQKHKKNLNDRTILVSINGTLGNVALYRGEKVILGKSACYFNVLDSVDRQFVRYVIADQSFQNHINNFATGSTIKNVSLRLMRDFKFLLPPLGLQREISRILEMLDNRIALLRETNVTLESIALALFKSWFVDFDPVRANQEGRVPEGMDEATAALFPDQFEKSESGMLPKGWRITSLRESLNIFDSKRVPLSGQERSARKGAFPYYGAAALMDYVDDFLFDGIYLLVGEDGSVADTAGFPITQYVWGKIWVNNHAHVLQGANGVSTEHLMLALKRTKIEPYITGAVQAKLSQGNMWRIPFLMPTREIAELFGETIAPLFAHYRHNAERVQTLTALRDTLLPRLISGQLQVPKPVEIMKLVA
jgi:type I restriction enzyme S subunit